MGRAATRTGGRDATAGVIPGRYALSVGMPDLDPPPGWKWTLLTDVARLETGHTPSRRHPEYWGGDVPWIGIRDATAAHGCTLQDTAERTNELGIANSSARILPANTVCLSRTASVGYVVVMGKPMATSQDFVNWVCSDKLDFRFLKYVLLAERDSFHMFASGSVHQTIYFPEVKAFHICLPPIEEQRRIADVLGALDKKIELNRQMNRTLEAVARAMFKSWFVDFDPVRRKMEGVDVGLPGELAALFPDDTTPSALGPVPSGWPVVPMGQFASLDKGVSYKGAFLDDAGTPMVNLGCFLGSGGFAIEKLKGYAGDCKARHRVRAGDVLVANTDMTQRRKVLGSPALAPTVLGGELIFSHHVYALRFEPQEEYLRPFVYFSLLAPGFRERAEGFATGTTVLALPREAILGYEVALPPRALIQRFNAIAELLIRRQSVNDVQSPTLARLRDALLPALLGSRVEQSWVTKMGDLTLPMGS